jgi:hypothetical protein
MEEWSFHLYNALLSYSLQILDIIKSFVLVDTILFLQENDTEAVFIRPAK